MSTLEAISKKMKGPSKPSFPITQDFKKFDSRNTNEQRGGITSSKIPFKPLTTEEMAARREKKLCYNCDEVYTPGHRCKQRVFYMIMTR